MKLKKFLLILLAAVSCACIGFAFGCVVDPGTTDNNECTVNFELSEHVWYVIDGKEVAEYQMKVDKDSSVKFSVVVEDGFLADTVAVRANGKELSATDGVYSHFVGEDTTINATVLEDLLEGDGTNENPYKVSSLKDLRSVANMVNSGYPSYVTGSYRLLNDIDCGGAQLDVIGNSDQYAFFSGIFDGQGHTISNYTISTVGQTFVGFFGCVQLSTSTTTVIIQNLNLKNFTINATSSDEGNVLVGGIAAVTGGANVVACSAEGDINVYGSGYFSYAGGAVGVQQSLTVTQANNTLYHYHSTTEYVHTKVRISAGNGYVLAAGGVVGYAISSHERATSMIMNSYAECQVSGAMSCGGVVGRLGDYSSIANCYSTGLIDTTVSFENTGTNVEDEEYFAYAGGIAGYVGAETTISDSFTTCILNAVGINTDRAIGDIYAYASPKTAFVNAVTVFNSYASCETELQDAVVDTHSDGEAEPTSVEFINKLGWNNADWVIKEGAYPSTNLAQADEVNFEITLNYLGNNTVKNAKTKVVPVQVKDQSYFSFSSHLVNSIDETIVADAAGHTSYGFFFDEECTKRVHYSYVPTRNIDIYVGFADYSEVEGTYEFKQATGRTVKLTLNTDATFTYLDVRLSGGKYVYDGDKLIFNDALFARLSGNSVIGENERPMPWLSYEPYRFVGALSGNELLVYDGTYFTNEIIDGKDNRLAFTKAGTEQNDKNGFVGTWERSATINEKYVFNSDMTWSYSWKTDKQSGKYSISEGVATLTNLSEDTVIATASIDNSGLLLVKKAGENDKYFCIGNSFLGNWYSSDDEAYLVLDGCGNELAGSATAIIDGVYFEDLSYVKDGFFDAFASNNHYTYTILSSYSLFGYFTYNAATNTITANLYDASIAGFQEFNFVLYDYYLGEWITQDEVGGETPFTIMDFNGLGLYKAEGDATLGYIVINKTRVSYECSVESGLNGTFTYDGTEYVLTTNGDGTVTITAKNGGNSAEFFRKDEMASTPLVDAEDNVYRFNGGGKLSNGGILTITYSQKSDKWGTIEEYGYKIESGSIDELDIVINLFSLVDGKIVGESVGTINIDEPKFVLQFNGQKAINLDLYFAFSGQWSISGLMNNFRIGKFDLTYEARGTYNGVNNVPFVYFPERNYIVVNFLVPGDGFESYELINYLLLIDDNNLIVSSYPYLVSGDQTYYATHSDELVGQWQNTQTGASLEFDGCADSEYSVGIAWDSTNGITYLYTRRFGTLYMWLEEGENVVVAYTLNYDEYDDEFLGEIVYRKPNTRYGSLKLTEVSDILGGPIFTAEGNGIDYEFNFDGTVKVGDKNGRGSINSVSGNVTTMEITLEDGTVMTVEVNHIDHTVTVIE